MSAFWSYSTLFGFGGEVMLISVSSALFFIIEGLFTMYSDVV